jgi:hypothetical protein
MCVECGDSVGHPAEARRPERGSYASLSKSTKSEREGEIQMRPHTGDTITVESEKVGKPSRTGVIEEVLKEAPLRVRVLWQDGHTSILAPSAGAARITSGKTSAKA